MIKKFFKFDEHQTTLKTETIAGLTTFLAMVYIIFVNPIILSEAGIPLNSAFTATVIATAIGTVLMALVANTPFALAPGMGINAAFAYTAVIGMGFTWQEALFGIFISGILFFILSITSIRSKIIKAIPDVIKSAVGVGIGFFIAFIGLKNSAIIVANPSTLVGLGDLSSPLIIVTIIAIFSAIIFICKKNNIGLFITMIVTLLVILTGQYLFNIDFGLTSITNQETNLDFSSSLFACFDIDFAKVLTNMNFWIVVFSFLFVDFFDTTGMLVTIGKKANLIAKDGSIKNEREIMSVDSLSTIIGSCLGTSSVTTFMESLSGISVGGKTGFTAIVVALCFLLSLVFYPLFVYLQPVMNALATPALVTVGILMISHISEINLSIPKNAATTFFTIIMTILCYSISEGIAVGIITYCACSLFDGSYKKTSPIMFILCVVFLVHYILI